MIEFILLGLAVVFLGISLVIGAVVKGAKKRHKISDGEIRYTDLNRPAKALFSKRLMLAGKPDYIVKTKDGTIPVEVKSTNADAPYKNHILQLAAYCFLVEDSFNTDVPYGILVYDNRKFKVLFDNGLRNELLKVLEDMRGKINTGDVGRNHNSRNKCVSCSFGNVCDFKLN